MSYKVLSATRNEVLQVLESLHHPSFDYNSLKVDGSDSNEIIKLDVEVKPVEAQVIQYLDGPTYLMWRCEARYRNKLMVNGEEFIAKNITWKYGRIAWTAGGGWPLYEIPCPPKRGLPTHRLKGIFGGKAFDPCSTPASGEGAHMTSVSWEVSDDKYDDNTGFFELIITAYSKE